MKRSNRTTALATVSASLLVALGLTGASKAKKARAAMTYAKTPTMIASDHSMGVAIADINKDGSLDIVVANGSDAEKRHVVVFYGDRGKFHQKPDFTSDDAEIDFHNSVVVGDIDHDGWIDLVVSVAPSPGTEQSGGVKIYYNHGGHLDKTGTFVSKEGYKSVGCALGDVDGDGDLDLAVAVAEESKPGVSGPIRIYKNDHGKLAAAPVWMSEKMTSIGVQFGDVDGDGFLDLVAAAPGIPVYRGASDHGGAIRLQRKPLMLAADKIQYPISVDIGRLGGAAAVAVAYNDFFAGDPASDVAGRARPRGLMRAAAHPAGAGVEECKATTNRTTHAAVYAIGDRKPPLWTSRATGWWFDVLWADVNGDDHLDLVATSFGPALEDALRAPLRIYLGSAAATSLSADADWSSGTCNAQQFMAAADLDRQKLALATDKFDIDRARAVVTLSHQMVDDISEVRRNGALVSASDYATVPGANWISFKERLQPRDKVAVRYFYPTAVDLVVTSFSSANMIFYHDGSH